MTLPEAELAFYFAAQAQLEPELRPVFAERVANSSTPTPRSVIPAQATSIVQFVRHWSDCGCRRQTLSSEQCPAGTGARRNSSKSANRR